MATVEFDLSSVKKWAKDVKTMAEAEKERFLAEAARELESEFIKRVQARTPVDKGTLKDGWRTKEKNHTPDGYEIVIHNPVDYAEYVEYGHRIINKKGELKGFKDEKKMMWDTEIEMESIMAELLEKKYEAFLKKVFGIE